MALRDVLIVGAGPAGLATAIAARQLGLDHQVVEQGSIVDAMYRYPTHMSFFTTPELLEIGGMQLVTPFEKPTRLEAHAPLPSVNWYLKHGFTIRAAPLVEEGVLWDIPLVWRAGVG